MKTIFTGLAPNLTKKDLTTALSFLLLPNLWKKWRKGEEVFKLETKLKKIFLTKDAVVFDSGRSALYFALKALGVKDGDEVLVQAFTCIVVVNSIKWTGAKPVYIDIERDFNLNPDDLQKKLSNKARVLIIQHTFGQPANIEKLINIAKQNNLYVIEDCAHALGAKYNQKLLGTFGNIGMLSFGSDKVLSCVRGGALITNDESLAQKIREYADNLPSSKLLKIFQHLMHYPIFALGKKVYDFYIGKIILVLAKKINLINRVVYNEEKLGLPVIFYPAKLPNALAKIIDDKLDSLPEVIKHQKQIAAIYDEKINNPNIIKPDWNEDHIWLRYPILMKNSHKVFQLAKKQKLILGNWYDTPVAPADIDLKATDYVIGSCPNEEKLSAEVLNLPTDININEKEAFRLVNFLNSL